MKNNELLEAVNLLEKEKQIPKEILVDVIYSALYNACKNTYGKCDNITIDINPETFEYHIIAAKTVVEAVENMDEEISLEKALEIDGSYQIGDVVNVEINSKEFGRLAATNCRSNFTQKIREVESELIEEEYSTLINTAVTGIVQRYMGKNISVNLGKTDGYLSENEQVKGEHFEPTDRLKVYIVDVKNGKRGIRVNVSRSHPNLVRCLFEEEVSEIKDGIVEIKSIAREAGSRTKMAVSSTDEDVDAVGACVGVNGDRVNNVVDELQGEKIDIIEWSETPAILIQNALSPAEVMAVVADVDKKTAKVIVPDYQLSLAIGREGQNARLAARLTGYKIDIKSLSQANEDPEWVEIFQMDGAGEEDDYYDDYDEDDEFFDDEEDFDSEDNDDNADEE